jgi:hypothetical protein
MISPLATFFANKTISAPHCSHGISETTHCLANVITTLLLKLYHNFGLVKHPINPFVYRGMFKMSKLGYTFNRRAGDEMFEWGVSKEVVEKGIAKAEEVAKIMASKQKVIAQEILAELAKREQQKGAWA